jgi:threonine synthase
MAVGVLARWAPYLPITAHTPALTLAEGDTPLLAVPRLAAWVGVDELYIKFEGMNPTASFKDRGMVVAVAKALEAGARTVLCASTGNTAASAAAYAARAGMTAVVLLPGGKVAAAKIAQALAYGARAVAIDGSFDTALDVARALADQYPAALVNSVNPHRIAGQATAAYEIIEALGDAPDVLALPVGNGGNITAYWSGFCRWHALARARTVPKMIGGQAAGAAPLVLGHPVDNPQTIATAIRIGRPASWQSAVAAAAESHGEFRAIEDPDILTAARQIAHLEGIFCEPSSAAGVAALRSSVAAGHTAASARCVCVCTGHGLKDAQATLQEVSSEPPAPVPATPDAVAKALRW